MAKQVYKEYCIYPSSVSPFSEVLLVSTRAAVEVLGSGVVAVAFAVAVVAAAVVNVAFGVAVGATVWAAVCVAFGAVDGAADGTADEAADGAFADGASAVDIQKQ